jgi:hypothetical protein
MTLTHHHQLPVFFCTSNFQTPCITEYINFPDYIPNLTSVKDNPKIYNKLMFFKTLPKRTRKVIFAMV